MREIWMITKEKQMLPLGLAYKFGTANGLAKEVEAIRKQKIDSFPTEWPRSRRDKTVRRGYVIQLFEQSGVFSTFKELCWHPVKADEQKQRYMRLLSEYEEHMESMASGEPDPDNADEDDVTTDDQTQRFVLESHLHQYLVKNLSSAIEPGLTLYRTENGDGVEFRIDDKCRIDILAQDASGRFVVIEIKRSRGKRSVTGQLLQYMAWVNKNLGNGSCRGIIIANKISNELITSVSEQPNVSLREYRLNVEIVPVTTSR
jgi:hypothetical protein